MRLPLQTRDAEQALALHRHWVSAVLTYNGHEHQLKTVMNIE